MRSLALLACLLATLPLTFVAPQIGVLIWSWLSFMSPQSLAFLPIPVPLVYVVALMTMGAWFFSREPKRLPSNITPWLLILFVLDMTLSSSVSITPALVWPHWERNVKTMLLAVMIMFVMTNRVRLQALIWIIVLSIEFYAVKGAIFVLATAGSSRVQGPPGSMITDNNTMGLAMVMIWPLIYYLRSTSEDRRVRLGLLVMMGLSILAILGTYSRGAFVAFSFVAVYFWLKSKRKVLVGFLGVCVLGAAISFLPDRWMDRMNSINTYQADSSATDRLQSWNLAMRIAAARPLTGVGFDAMATALASQLFMPERKSLHVAHSIWFEPLSDHGIPGLAIFITIGAVGFYQAGSIRRKARAMPEWAWAGELATMSQLSFAGYFAAGTFLSMPYYDVYYAMIAAISVLHDMVRRAAQDATVPLTSSTFAPLARPVSQPATVTRHDEELARQ